ncbi:Transposase InsO and inactivated derivatives [Bacillus sp. 491mf]|nr:Transposase InsO and inactivated derivatives [Bacillus sp. 491mf]
MVPEVIVTLVEEMKNRYSISLICECMGISRATYYRWRRKPWGLSPLEKQIKRLCTTYKFRIGHRTVTGLLRTKLAIQVNRKTVQRIMQKYDLQCRVKPKRKMKVVGESQKVVPNRFEQNFQADRPNQKWVTDITYLPFGESMMYLSTIMDLYNNEIIAYRVKETQDVTLVLEAASKNREVKGVTLHSDQGSVYTSYAFQDLSEEKGIITSMSRKGNCFDNAVIESFHSTIKSEEFYTLKRVRLTNSIVLENVNDFMHYYNHMRPFKKLNYLSPVEYREQVA